jgi:hypothetical protein
MPVFGVECEITLCWEKWVAVPHLRKWKESLRCDSVARLTSLKIEVIAWANIRILNFNGGAKEEIKSRDIIVNKVEKWRSWKTEVVGEYEWRLLLGIW